MTGAETPVPVPPPPSEGLSPAARRVFTFGLAGLVAALDQVVKVVVDNVLPPWGTTVGPLFDFQRVYNPGVNFGLLSDFPQVVIVATLVIGVGFAAYVLTRPPQRWTTIGGFALLLGGGFGNLVDRFRLGAVFDYLNITPFVGYLNLADLAIGAGVILLLLDAMLRREPG
ncbi:MAG: signal peptidase II [Chloroflexota bacterium]|nr:signal peptidase II [Chloroflexota bacterium]MDE2918677.1 signal peptidase II [Chloroflexota bacterium]